MTLPIAVGVVALVTYGFIAAWELVRSLIGDAAREA